MLAHTGPGFAAYLPNHRRGVILRSVFRDKGSQPCARAKIHTTIKAMDATRTSSDRHAASRLLGEILRCAQNDDKNAGRTFTQPSRQLPPVRARLQPCRKNAFRPASACAFYAQAFVTADHDSPTRASLPDWRSAIPIDT